MRRTAILLSGLISAGVLGWIGPVADAQPSGPTVQVIDFEYTPRAVTVAVGAPVLWRWDGSEAHTVSARDGSFESGEKNRGDQFSFTFRTAGRVEYFCRVHPNLMTGTVTVQAPPPSPSPRPTSAAPRPTSAAPTPAPTTARPSASRTSAPPQTLPAPPSARPSASSAAPSAPPSRSPSPSAVRPLPELTSPSLAAGTAAPRISRSPLALASLDEPRPKDRTGLAIALALLVAAGGIGLGTTLLLRGRMARKLSSPSP